MALIVKESSWWQTPAKVFIKVPLNNIPTDKVDVFTSEKYIKLHFDRYIFEKLLLHPIDEEASTVRLGNNEAEFELLKAEEALWDQLEIQVSKRDARDLKVKLLDEHIERLKLRNEEIKKKKDKRLKDAVSVQMKLETQEQKDVSKLKECQKWEALSGNYDNRTPNIKQILQGNVVKSHEKTSVGDTNKPCSTNGVRDKQNGTLDSATEVVKVDELVEIKRTDVVDHDDCEDRRGVVITELPDEDVEFIEKKGYTKSKKSSNKELMEKITRQVRERIKAEEKQKVVPKVRGGGQIGVTFTPRVFPTPKRESMAPEEEEWLKKQAAAREACGFCAADLRPEENNPDWVKARGDQMYAAGNYLGASSAYSHGLRLCPKLASFYSSRAAAQLAMNNLHKAADDASEALQLLTPPCESNRQSRIEAHLIRGRALVQLKAPKLGLPDLEQALSLSAPGDEILKQEVEGVRALAELPNEETEIDFSSPPLVITQ